MINTSLHEKSYLQSAFIVNTLTIIRNYFTMLFVIAGLYLDFVNNASVRVNKLPPILALILCTTFVLFLLRPERKQSPDVTRALWIPTIWMLCVASKPLGIWFQSGGDLESGSRWDRAFLTVILCIALWILVRRKFDWFSAVKDNVWLTILIVFMLASILWSNMPYISFKRWTREFIAILMAFVVLSETSPRQAIESIIRRITYILIPFSILLIKYFPKYGVEYGRWSGELMWMGVTQQKNALSLLCLLAALFLIWSLVRRWQGHNPPVWKYQTHAELFVLVMTFRLMGGPRGNLFYSATANISLTLGLLVYWGFHLMKKFKISLRAGTLMTFVVIIIIFGIIAIFSGGTNVGYFASSVKRDATLTGRTQVWATLVPIAMQRPLLGGGFGGFWTTRAREEFEISGAHSGYLDVLLGLGFSGIFLVSIFLLTSCRKAHRGLSHNYDWGALSLIYLIIVVSHNITESSIDTFTSPLTAVLLFLSVSSTKIFSSKQQV